MHKLLLDLKYITLRYIPLLVAHKVTLLLMLKRRMNKNVMNLNNRAKTWKDSKCINVTLKRTSPVQGTRTILKQCTVTFWQFDININ